MKFNLGFSKSLLRKIFDFNDSSNYFIFCDLLLGITGLNLKSFRKCFGSIAIFSMLIQWFFISQDFYNFINPFNLDLIMSGLGGYLIYMMGMFKFIVIVSYLDF